MPSLQTLPEEELTDLADEYTKQAIKTQELKNLLKLTDKEKTSFALSRPASLHDLKNKIQELLTHKSKKNNLYQETKIHSSYEINDPQLIEAARLGKKALKDPDVMKLLWKKFQNQNKIATFLGVNRSSVNRRCKVYQLQ